MLPRSRPSAQMLRWLALGGAAGAALTLLFNLIGIAGPWQVIALVLTLLAAFAALGTVFALRRRDRQMLQADERSEEDQRERGVMQKEIDRHTQLEHQLRQSKQAAESAVMAKGEFLATMSHEIRTPLNGIVPMLDLLMHAQLAPDHAELVRTAYTSSQQMLRIVDDILDYSKLEANKLDLESTGFNLRELMESVIQLMDRPAQSKGLRLNLQIESSVRLPVRGDPVRLRQVLSNLISNAVKFTDRGSVSVTVRRIGETSAQHQLRFEVRDTGIGIALESQNRLFQAFSQADASTTRLYGGTGLGLAISKRIVELMGGRIGVDSDAGHGATFWFEVPMLKVQGDMATRPAEASSGGRLLLLSSDPRLRLRLSMLLPNWGLRVSSVETTQEALDRLRTAANQGQPWAYSMVLADLVGIRNTAVALHRNLDRQAVYGDLRLVFLYGDDAVPEELKRNVTMLSRQAPDDALRAALTDSTASRSDDSPRATAHASRTEPSTPDPASRPMSTGLSSSTSHVALQGDGATLRGARVLLVEDNPVNLMVGQRLLSVLGIVCDTASNGEAALMRMSASRYDVVLMDCQMPVMDGYTATRRWREGEADAGDGRHVPIIAMTANAMAGDRQKCLDAGMDDYLPKPVTRSELERCLHRWWNTDQVRDRRGSVELGAAGTDIVEAPAVTTSAAQDIAAAPQSWARPASADDASTPAPSTRAAPEAARPSTTALEARFAPPASQTRSRDGEAGASASNSAPVRVAPPPVIDADTIAELRTMLGNEVDHLIDVFLEDSPRLIRDLESAAAGPDMSALRDAAHSLKSSSANLGAMSLSEAAKRVEAGARTETLERPAVAVALIANEFERARRALRNVQAGAASA